MRRRSSGFTVALALGGAGLWGCEGGLDEERSGSLVPPTATVEGRVIYRARIALPPDAQVEVALADVSRQDVPARILASEVIAADGRQVPIPFALAYDPSVIDERLSYGVLASIRAQGRLLFTTTVHHPVITGGNPTSLDVTVEAVGGPDAPLQRTEWILVEMDGQAVVPPQGQTAPVLSLAPDGGAAGSTGCNRFTGRYAVDDQTLRLGPLAVTRRACPRMNGEAAFLDLLEGDLIPLVRGRFLTLTTLDGRVARFRAAPP